MPTPIAGRRIAGRRGIGRRPIASRVNVVAGSVYNFPRGSYTFAAPKAGYWKFVGWGPGGAGDGTGSGRAGDAGGYFEKTVYLDPSHPVAVVVPAGAAATTVTLPNGAVLTANQGADGSAAAAGGTATGGDVNLSGATAGNAGSGTGGAAAGGAPNGGGASANLPFRGPAGGDSTLPTPGYGGGGYGSGAVNFKGGPGHVLALFVKD
jgi:hypothetical protein